MTGTKPILIDKQEVLAAWKQVRKNAGAAGCDQQSISDFEQDLKNNLYKVWNRMSSGSYMPPPVKAVEIPKRQGGKRLLGIPAVADRVAQTVIRNRIEPCFESVFLETSYGYRPGRSAHDAVAKARFRCWKYNYVLEYDIRGLFDHISHKLLLKAVRCHIKERWILVYIERWLKASIILENGETKERVCGTPQGGVISPLLSNLFLHYGIDCWMERCFKTIPWVRYADDGIMFCHSRKQAEFMKKNAEGKVARSLS